ncbi:putative mitochondrial carrier protein [Helianthus annuus]|nr:putative mitochondrial carrier protein [Helianthus annuus]KAJ0475164.1 putative mitochondrial carrier protein [Helianthus annuus]KAJ0650720.1 putative mitochondrial carrier protein [Helianthus annuus]KAJ0654473.1 putative mitochondrial carrier protein [Helianthus annuus]
MQTEGVVESGGSLVVETVSQLIPGGVAGAVSKTCTAPLARLTILFQVQGMHSDASTLRKSMLWREASRIVNEEGFRAFWKGNLVTVAHRLPYSSISFYAVEHYKNVASGGLAGITAASVTHPLDLVRTRLSAQRNVMYYRGISHALRTISREEGIFGLYKGLGACLLGVGPNLAISFSVYDTARSYWQLHRQEDSTALVSLACGSLSGIASSTVTFPLDLVRRRMQLEGAGGRARVYKTGILGTFRQIIKAEGFRGIYRGILPEYYKVVPSIGILFMTCEKLKQVFSKLDACR